MSALNRETKKLIEHHFYNYTRYRDNAVDRIVDTMPCSLNQSGTHGQRAYSDPTANKAIRLAEATKWCYVVEQTIQHFQGTGKDKLIELWYIQGLGRQKRGYEKVANKLFCDITYLYRMIDDCLSFAAVAAAQLGLLKVI